MKIFRILKSKKGEELPTEPNYVIYFMIAASIIGLFAVFLVIATSSYQSSTTQVLGNLKATIAQYRMTHSTECFAYQNTNTKRIYSATVDLSKFTQERLNKCMLGLTINNVCFDLTLKEMNGNEIRHIKTSNYREPEKITVKNWIVNVFDKGSIGAAMLTIKQGDPC